MNNFICKLGHLDFQSKIWEQIILEPLLKGSMEMCIILMKPAWNISKQANLISFVREWEFSTFQTVKRKYSDKTASPWD